MPITCAVHMARSGGGANFIVRQGGLGVCPPCLLSSDHVSHSGANIKLFR